GGRAARRGVGGYQGGEGGAPDDRRAPPWLGLLPAAPARVGGGLPPPHPPASISAERNENASGARLRSTAGSPWCRQAAPACLRNPAMAAKASSPWSNMPGKK